MWIMLTEEEPLDPRVSVADTEAFEDNAPLSSPAAVSTLVECDEELDVGDEASNSGGSDRGKGGGGAESSIVASIDGSSSKIHALSYRVHESYCY